MKKQTSNWSKIRGLFNDIHLWLGLASGVILVAVCLSGTIYVYNTELREMASPELFKVEKGSERISSEVLLQMIKDESGGEITGITIPNDLERSYQISVRTKGDKSRFGTSYYVNPYTGSILGTSLEKTRTDEFMSIMFSLHRWLLLDRVENPIINGLENRKLGSYISGTATILFTIGALTGLVLWFPPRLKNWRQGLKIKAKGNWKRTIHDLHNTLGFYSAILLIIMGITGPQWSFEWYRTGLRKALGTYDAGAGSRGPGGSSGKEKETAAAPILAYSLEHYISEVDKRLDYPGNYRVTLPKTEKDDIQVSKTKVGFFAPAAADQASISITSAEITEVDIFGERPFNERVSSSIKALHVGDVYGSFSKLLYFIACAIATSLPITGTLIWLNKMKKSGARSKKTKRPISSGSISRRSVGKAPAPSVENG